MFLHSFLLLAQLQAGASWFAATEESAPLTPSALHDAVEEFIWEWRFTWEASQTMRYGFPRGPILSAPCLLSPDGRSCVPRRLKPMKPPDPNLALRLGLVHCHPDGSYAAGHSIKPFLIDANVGKHAICPAWFLGPGATTPWDERLSIDASLIAPLRSGVREARDSLLALLDEGSRRFANDDWVAGQRVRFALDQGDTVRALRAAAATCTGSRWWCSMLEAFVRYGRDPAPAVGIIFDRAVQEMPQTSRCQWNNFGMVIDPPGRADYGKRSCAQRDSINRILWWLSDPLYLEPGNDRRDEQLTRKVTIALRSGTNVSERWDWDSKFGGTAFREMIERYGWPAISEWGNPDTDRGHFSYLGTSDPLDRERGVFATAEYPSTRYHTVPAWEAILDPFTAEPEDWNVWNQSAATKVWWPTEHFPRATPLIQPDVQVALLRREHNALLAVATSFYASDLGWPRSDSVVAHLFTSTSPDSFAEHRTMQTLRPALVVQSALAARPTVVSLEMTSPAGGQSVARVRFGASPAKPLAEMELGTIDISRAIILRPLEAGAVLPSDPVAALANMAGSTIVHQGERIGIYWETYGIAAGDTVDVSVSINRPRDRSRMEKLAAIFGGGGPKTEGITVAWREPRNDHDVTTIPGRIPIQGRQLTLALSNVEAGDWNLTVSIGRPGKPPVSRVREFRIAPR